MSATHYTQHSGLLPASVFGKVPLRTAFDYLGKGEIVPVSARNRNLPGVLLHMALAKSGGIPIRSSDAFSTLVLRSSAIALSPTNDENANAKNCNESNKPVQLVFFSAPWCGPARLTNPVVKDVMKRFSNQIDVYELNTDDLPEVAELAGVVSIPTIQIYRGGDMVEAIVGCVAKNVLAACVRKALEDVSPH